ncbi:hypothetical protein C8R44DRAFT_752227 [Mycena epipterygia]|nr:hypothetical protein C8R44DRAFT_752227 [Mycena epipterygia]
MNDYEMRSGHVEIGWFERLGDGAAEAEGSEVGVVDDELGENVRRPEVADDFAVQFDFARMGLKLACAGGTKRRPKRSALARESAKEIRENMRGRARAIHWVHTRLQLRGQTRNRSQDSHYQRWHSQAHGGSHCRLEGLHLPMGRILLLQRFSGNRPGFKRLEERAQHVVGESESGDSATRAAFRDKSPWG